MDQRQLRDVLTKGAVLVLAGLWIFSPAYHGDWLWDDDVVLTQNPDVLSGSLGGLSKIWADPTGLDYFPLTYSLMWLQHLFFGPQSTGYHVTTILLHIAGGLLFWRLLWTMGIPGAWTSALVFTIHPACVESVAWVAETKNTLCLPLFLASCLLWVKQDGETPGPRRERLYLGAIALFLLSMLAKTSPVGMPVLTLLYAWWRRGTVSVQDLVRVGPLVLVSIVLGLVTLQFQWGRAIGGETLPVGGFGSRLATAGMAILFYLSTIVWPVRLLPIYPRWDVDPPKAWQFLPWLVIGGVAWWVWRNRDTAAGRNVGFALGSFLVLIAPVLGFVDISYMRITWVADHFLYLPMLGPLALVVAVATTWLEAREDRERTVFTGLAAGALIFLGVNSFLYAIAWIDEDHLWEHTLLHNHDAWQAHNRLGIVKFMRNDVEGAHYHFRNSSRLRPDLAETNLGLGTVLQRLGRMDEAIAAYRDAVRASPTKVPVRESLANACLAAGRYEEARDAFQFLLEIDPDNPVLLHRHALALFKTGSVAEAIAEFRRVLEIDPGFHEAEESLKVALAKQDGSESSDRNAQGPRSSDAPPPIDEGAAKKPESRETRGTE
jgi:tetratricopeptide (TPR) repeat protein